MIARAPLGALAAGAAGCVAFDALLAHRGERMLPLPVAAGADWLAHLATTAVVLRGAVAPGRLPALAGAALVASVAIDVDHVPLALAGGIGPGAQRPVTHHLAAPLVPLALGALLRGRARDRAVGAALGLAGHLGRDLFSGPGVRGRRLPWRAEPLALAPLMAAAAARGR